MGGVAHLMDPQLERVERGGCSEGVSVRSGPMVVTGSVLDVANVMAIGWAWAQPGDIQIPGGAGGHSHMRRGQMCS